MNASVTLAALLEKFFTHRLMNQRQASPHTISSYRDTFRLLLQFAQQRLHKTPTGLAFDEIDAPMIAAFLDDLECRGSCPSPNLNRSAPGVHLEKQEKYRGRRTKFVDSIENPANSIVLFQPETSLKIDGASA